VGVKGAKRIEIGERNGSNVVMEQRGLRYLVRCDCGAERTLASGCVRISRQCPRCNGANRRLNRNILRHKDPLYMAWCAMRKRCRSIKGWADRGIIVCEPWLDFEAFRAWALDNGFSKGLSIDRINSLGNYEPSNCQWVSRQENSRRVHDDWRSQNHFPIEMLWGVC